MDGDAHPHQHADQNAHRYQHTNMDGDRYIGRADRYTDCNLHRDAHGDANMDAGRFHAYANGYQDANAYAHAHTYPNAHSDRDAHGYEHAYCYRHTSHRNAYAVERAGVASRDTVGRRNAEPVRAKHRSR